LNRCQKNSFMGDGRRRRETENENGHNFGQFESFLVVLQEIRRGRSRNALQANCKHEKTFKCNQITWCTCLPSARIFFKAISGDSIYSFPTEKSTNRIIFDAIKWSTSVFTKNPYPQQPLKLSFIISNIDAIQSALKARFYVCRFIVHSASFPASLFTIFP
jgi:hypothetical protein